MTLFVYIYVLLWIIGGIIAFVRCCYNSVKDKAEASNTPDNGTEHDSIDVSC